MSEIGTMANKKKKRKARGKRKCERGKRQRMRGTKREGEWKEKGVIETRK